MTLAALLSTTLATAAARGQAVPAPVVQPGESADDARLKQLFYNSDESSLKRHPIEAVFRGDLRYADRFGDYLTDAYLAAERAAVEHDLATLNTIDRTKLTPTDQIAYDVFKTRNETDLAGFAPALLKVQRDLPIDHMNGFQTFYPDFASGNGAAPFKTLADYENNLKRNAKYAVVLDRAIGLFRQGMKDKIVQPKLVVTNMIQEFDNLIAEGVEGSTFYGPVKSFPATIPAADQARLKAAYGAQIRDVIIPAHRQMRDFLVNVYLPAARDTVGLSSLPGGDAYYTFLIRQNTTLPMTAEQVHQLGLTEVARILKGMEAQKQAVGFKGDLPTFFAFLRTDKQFQPSSVDQLRDGYRAIEGAYLQTNPRAILADAEDDTGYPPGPGVQGKDRGGRIVQRGHARRVATGRVLLQHLRPALAVHVGNGNAVPPRGRTGASFPDQPCAGKHRAARVHAVRWQHRLCRGLGALCRKPVEGARHGDRSV